MLAADRRAQIVALAQGNGSVRVTDITATLRVSEATARRDLDALAADGVVTKVYGGATLNRARRSTSTVQVGVMLPASTAYYPRIIDGIREASDQAPPQVTLNLNLARTGIPNETMADVLATERAAIDSLLAQGVDGLLLMPALPPSDQVTPATTAYADWLAELPVPTVLVDRELPDLRIGGPSTVRTGHERGAAAAVRALAELDHRRIALLARADTQTSELIKDGWRRGLAEVGLEVDDSLCLTGKATLDWAGWTNDALDGMLDHLTGSGATAVVCHNDDDALTLVARARARGLGIPDELSIIAYEDEFAALSNPALTAIAPRRRQLGRLALRTLLELIQGKDSGSRHLMLDPELVVRDSVAPPTS